MTKWIAQQLDRAQIHTIGDTSQVPDKHGLIASRVAHDVCNPTNYGHMVEHRESLSGYRNEADGGK